MPTDIPPILMLLAIVIGLFMLPILLMVLVEALPLIVAILVALWVYHQVT